MAIINIGNKTVIPISSSILPAGGFNIDAMYQTEYISDLWSIYPTSGDVKKVIQEGQQVYITKGSQWIVPHSELEDYSYPEILPEGYEIIKPEGMNFDVIRSKYHKGEIWVLTDKQYFNNAIFKFDVQSFTEQDTEFISGWTKLETSTSARKLINTKQDKLVDGSEEKPHLIWSSDGWNVGKIKIDDTVPEENKIKDTVLSFDGTKVIWKTLDTTSNLPTDDRETGNVLTVGEQGNLIWSSISQVEIEEHGNLGIETIPITESYTISNKNISANIYSKAAVDNMLSWDMI